ncbi:HAD family hydrolase, partial [bacterium]|nr:HAD family hydrolase [bacterium]
MNSVTPPPGRGIFTNRTLNLRSIKAIGYDMDYTLIHYNVRRWEQVAYEHLQRKLKELGWPVGALQYDPDLIIRGLVVDREKGNLVKANRFGYVKHAYHGTRELSFSEVRNLYARIVVDPQESRWRLLTTLFNLSEACMYAQLVDLLDQKLLPGVMGYGDLQDIVRRNLDEAHAEGLLKEDITADPDTYIDFDPETVPALLDQKHAGNTLILITNSDWAYTRR